MNRNQSDNRKLQQGSEDFSGVDSAPMRCGVFYLRFIRTLKISYFTKGNRIHIFMRQVDMDEIVEETGFLKTQTQRSMFLHDNRQ